MKYKLKPKSKGMLSLHLVEISIVVFVLVCVVKYFASTAPSDPSGIPEFIFVAVLTLMIITRIGEGMNKSIGDMIKLFEKKKIKSKKGKNKR